MPPHSGLQDLPTGQEDDCGYGEPAQLNTTYQPLDPERHRHPLNDPNISYGIYSNGGVVKNCCIVKNFSKTEVYQHSDFASRMQKNGFSNLCLEVYAYDEPNHTLICEPFKSTLMSRTKQLIESGGLDCWEEQDNIISGQSDQDGIISGKSDQNDIISGRSLLRPLFGFLMVYAPEDYHHPDLLNSVYITDENKVKFLSKVAVQVPSRPFKSKKNLSEVVSFIYGISVVTLQKLEGIGNLKFPKSFPRRSSAHIPKSLQNLYEYLQSYEPDGHCARFFFDPPFLHRWHDRMHYVQDVYTETFCYNPSIKKKFRYIIKWDSWEKSLSKFNDVFKEYEDFRNSKIADGSSNQFYKPHDKNEGMIKYFVNIIKHLYSDLPHTQKAQGSDVSSASVPNPTPVNDLESMMEERLNVSGYAYMAINEYLKTHPQDVAEFSDRILTWQPLGL